MDAPLRMRDEEMRALGYRAVDEIVRHLTELRQRPVGQPPDRRSLEKVLDVAPPAGPRDPDEVMDQVLHDVLGSIVHTEHPRFMAYVPGPSTFVGAVADFLAAGFNVFAGQWLVGAGPAVLERVTVDWLRQLCGLPDTAAGLFVSGGTMANLVAMHAARFRLIGDDPDSRGVIYVTEHTHRSVCSGLRFLGFHEAQLRMVASDAAHRMSMPDLRTRIAVDQRAGLVPFYVVATAGTTSSGAVDPLAELARLCADSGLWLHVDAAYGGAAVLSERARHLLQGLGEADSVALDAHKWWFQPYEAGCVIVRDATALTDAFSVDAEYLRETRAGVGPLNFYDLGPQLTRSFRALKVWMSINSFGLDAFREAVDHGITLAEYAQALIAERPRWAIVTPAQLAVVTFRPRVPSLPDGGVDALTREIAAGTLRDGFALVTTTEIDGRPVLRLCTTHPETTREDVLATVDLLERLADRWVAPPPYRSDRPWADPGNLVARDTHR